MRIGFDAKRAFLNASGLGNYSRQLLRALYRYHPEHKYFLYSPKGSNRLEQDGLEYNFAIRTASNSVLPAALWRSLTISNLAKADDLNIYHGLSHELPLLPFGSKIKTVLSFHDLLYRRYPEDYPVTDRFFYERKYRRSAAKADLILAISQQTAADLQEFYGTASSRIRVIPQVVDPIFSHVLTERQRSVVLAALGLDKPFLLNIGSFMGRKNQAQAIQCLECLGDRFDGELILIGSGRDEQRIRSLAQASTCSGRIRIMTKVSSADLPALYQSAFAYLNTSLFEGWGLPLGEAMASGVPVVSNDEAVFREVGGEAIAYVPSNDAEAMAETIGSWLDSSDLRSTQIELGKKRSAAYTLSDYADRLIGLYRELL